MIFTSPNHRILLGKRKISMRAETLKEDFLHARGWAFPITNSRMKGHGQGFLGGYWSGLGSNLLPLVPRNKQFAVFPIRCSVC